MKRRIFLNMLLLAAISISLVSTALCFAYYRQFSSTIAESLRNRAETFIDNTSQTAIEALAITKSSDMRVTVIAPGGTVVFDNAVNAEDMPNHGDRQEIQGAFASGFGQSKRFSDTLREETVYYAVRLTDGYVLRVSKTSSGILGVFIGILPIAAGIVLVAGLFGYLLANGLTNGIVGPLNKVKLDEELSAPYDELAPFLKTIGEQRASITRQVSDLQRRADIINAIMDNINEGIILTDDAGVILSANKSCLRILGTDAQADGKNTLELLRDVDFSTRLKGALDGNSGEMSFERAGRIYRVYFSHVNGGGAIVLFLDTTERAKAEKLRREFSANVSHELKTPLTSIYGNAEMLCNGMIRDGDRQAFYGRIKDEAARMIALTEDILMLSSLDEGGGQELFEDVDLAAVAAEAVCALSQKAIDSAVAVRILGEGATIKANRSLMYEMFYNLTDNAIKYNKPDGYVNIEIGNVKGVARIIVSDTGIGIPEDAQSRVFERFYRVDKSRSKKTGGTGLGLAIVKHIVIAHGGEIELKSRVNEGTSVTVALGGAR